MAKIILKREAKLPHLDSELAAMVPRPLAKALEQTHAIATCELLFTTTWRP
ncbi:MAG: hypothetical protein AB1586_31755 [Pseudomonadota bacterium]|jgi:hypothetical protein